MKYLDQLLYNRIFEILTLQDEHICFVNEKSCDVSDNIWQRTYDMIYQGNFIGCCVMYQSHINLNVVHSIGIAFSLADTTIEFTVKDNIENSTSKYKLQYLNELLNQQIEFVKIQVM